MRSDYLNESSGKGNKDLKLVPIGAAATLT